MPELRPSSQVVSAMTPVSRTRKPFAAEGICRRAALSGQGCRVSRAALRLQFTSNGPLSSDPVYVGKSSPMPTPVTAVSVRPRRSERTTTFHS